MDQAVVFGDYEHLVGVFDKPSSCTVPDTAVMMITPGMLHHAGPFRLHVDLARSLSRQAIASLRFDLSGIGESLGVGASGQSLQRAASEIRQAIDYLEREHAINQVIVFGLCSGADDALFATTLDDRIVGLISLDGLGYRTPRYYWHRLINHYAARMVRPRELKRIAHRILDRGESVPRSLPVGSDVREYPVRNLATEQLSMLADRGVRMHFIYTGGVADYYNHAEQFFHMFPSLVDRAGISTRFFESMDHTAFLCEDREQLVDHIVATVASAFTEIEANSLSSR